MADNLSQEQRQFLDAACGRADRFNGYLVNEESLMNQLEWGSDEFSRIRNELEGAGYITRGDALRTSDAGGFWITQKGIDLCPEPLGGRDALQVRK